MRKSKTSSTENFNGNGFCDLSTNRAPAKFQLAHDGTTFVVPVLDVDNSCQSVRGKRGPLASIFRNLRELTPSNEGAKALQALVSTQILPYLMERSKSNLITRTAEVWQPHCATSISEEDAREIVENITGFFRLLLEWQAMENGEDACQTGSCYAIPA